MKRSDILTGVLCLGVFTSVANIVVLIPVLTAIARDFNVSEARVGQLAAVHALVAATVALLAAPLTDRYPRRLVPGVECAVLVVGTLISATVRSYAWLAEGRVFAGMGAAIIIATCLAIVTDLYPDETLRNRRLGTVASAAAPGTVIGLPILTHIANHANWHWTIAAIGVPAVIVGLGTWLLPDVRPTDDAALGVRASRWAAYAGRYRAIFADRVTACLLGIQVVLSAVIDGLWLCFAARLERDFVASAGALSALFLLSGLCELVTSNVTPRLLERVPAPTAFVAEAAVLAACLRVVGAVFTREWTMVPLATLVSLTGIGLLFINTVMLITAPASGSRGGDVAASDLRRIGLGRRRGQRRPRAGGVRQLHAALPRAGAGAVARHRAPSVARPAAGGGARCAGAIGGRVLMAGAGRRC